MNQWLPGQPMIHPLKKITQYVIIPLVTHYEKPLIVTLWLFNIAMV